jgi:hypothetical protein
MPADLVATADTLTAGLPRYHPSFRFVEALSARLTAAAVGHDRPAVVVALPVVPRQGLPADLRSAQVRPVVIGGVLTSAAISIAGAAYVAWRRGRPPADPKSRAVRAVARARLV